MKGKLKTFKLEPEVLDAMERLVKFPPPSLVDEKEGAPRNATALVRFLIMREAKQAEKKPRK